jgi:hypothetical protein
LGLKYITQYSEIAKPNRVYVPGDKINTTWADKVNSYAFNDTNGDYYMITDKKPLKTNYVVVKVIILYNVTYVMIYGDRTN